jgi:hypothetical protein
MALRPVRIALFTTAFLLVTTVVVTAFWQISRQNSTQIAQPSKLTVNWMPTAVAEAISPGETKTLVVSFAASKNIGHLSVQVSPGLQPFVRAEPASVAHTRRGQRQDITLVLASPTDAAFGTFFGTIELHKGKDEAGEDDEDVRGLRGVIPTPLLVTVNIWPRYSDTTFHVSLAVPPTLSRVPQPPSSSVLQPGQSETLAVFSNASFASPGNDRPIGGCFVSIEVEDNTEHLSLSDWLERRSFRQAADVDQEIQVSGETGLRRNGVDEIDGDPFVVVFVPHGSFVYSLNLIVHGSTLVDGCNSEFDQVVRSFRLGV